MHDIQLVANRFVPMPGASAIDLATGARVVMTIATAGGASEQTRWAVRCDTLRARRHPSIARLVDFGTIGGGQRFEAWDCGPPWRGQPDVAAQARDVALCVLRGCGLSTGDPTASAIREGASGPQFLPAFDVGYAASSDPGLIRSTRACAMALVDRPALAAIAELFDTTSDCRPRAVSLWGPEGAGKSTAIAELARAARLNGLVPISIALLGSSLAPAVEGRTLFIVDDAGGGEQWAALVHSVLRSPRPHVLVTTSVEETAERHGVALKPLTVESLVSSIRPIGIDEEVLVRVRRASEHAGGLPGRFAALLWRRQASGRRERRSPRDLLRAAEQTVPYGYEAALPSIAESMAPALSAAAWPAPGEMAALRRRLEGGVRLLNVGRHAPGDRALRQAIGGLARRSDWLHAAQGARALAGSLLSRGRAQDARAMLEDARRYCERAGHTEMLLDIATLAAHAWIDLVRLDEAESVLSAAVETAKARADAAQIAETSLAMARCLFWRGRYAEADTVLSGVPRDLPDEAKVRIAISVSRQAIGRRDLGSAVSASADAVQRALTTRDVGLQAEAACASAFAHLAVSDLDALDRDVGACVAHARAAKRPLHAIRARLLLVEAERRRERRTAATGLLDRLARIDHASLPPIVRAQCGLLAELLKPNACVPDIVARRTRASGLMGLALLVPDSSLRDNPDGLDAVVEHLVGILRVCQNADEETTVLSEVCARLRGQLHAASVAFLRADASGTLTIAADGGRVDPGIGRRAIDAGIAIAPHRAEDRIEAAVPVRYGGATIAALAARWSLGVTHSLSGAASVLTMGAAAAAPAVAAWSASRAASTRPGRSDLLGASAAMVDVRRAVERAAAAPFAVLIEGESGCGKELVARAVHRSGPRRDRAFCTLNCAALPDDLVESELFGHAKGAFTGAVGERPGVFEEAHGGTLFLDEIGDLSLRAQAKVLRVIQEGELRRVGENIGRRVDVRILSATNRDLRQDVASGRFRLDLVYRLDVLRIVIAPLRHRREDIAELVDHFWADAARRIGSHATLAAAAVAALARHDWPGNVRELQNVLAALAVRTPKRGVVAPTALPPGFGDRQAAETWRLDEARRTFETRFVRAALARAGGHRTQAASELGVSRQGLTKLMSRLGIGDAPQATDGVPDPASGSSLNLPEHSTDNGV